MSAASGRLWPLALRSAGRAMVWRRGRWWWLDQRAALRRGAILRCRPNLSTTPHPRWRRRWWRVVLARPEIRCIAENLRGIELAAVGRHPRHLRAVRALPRAEA